MSAEIIHIGGAAIVASYGFRNMTTDVDALIHAASSMKDAINSVGDMYDGHCHVKVDIYFTAVGMVDIPSANEICDIMQQIRNTPQLFRSIA